MNDNAGIANIANIADIGDEKAGSLEQRASGSQPHHNLTLRRSISDGGGVGNDGGAGVVIHGDVGNAGVVTHSLLCVKA